LEENYEENYIFNDLTPSCDHDKISLDLFHPKQNAYAFVPIKKGQLQSLNPYCKLATRKIAKMACCLKQSQSTLHPHIAVKKQII